MDSFNLRIPSQNHHQEIILLAAALLQVGDDRFLKIADKGTNKPPLL